METANAHELAGSDNIIFPSLLDHILNGFYYCRMLYDSGEPIYLVYLHINPSFQQLTGLGNVTGKHVSELIPGIYQSDSDLFEKYGLVAAGKNPVKFDTYIETFGHWISLSVHSSEPEHFVAIFDVITERKLSEQKLEQSGRNLSHIVQGNPQWSNLSECGRSNHFSHPATENGIEPLFYHFLLKKNERIYLE